MRFFFILSVLVFVHGSLFSQSAKFDLVNVVHGGPAISKCKATVTDEFGNLYVAGEYNGLIDLDPSSVQLNYTSVGGFDIFIQKFDINNNLLWVKSIGGSGWESVEALKLDRRGNLFLTGTFSDTVDFDPNINVENKIASNFSDVYLLKLDTLGSFKSVSVFAVSYPTNTIEPLDVDSFGQVYLTGNFSGNVDFDPGPGVYNLFSSSWIGDLFILKLDSLGALDWVKGIYGTSTIYGKAIQENFGNVYVTGSHFGQVDFDPGPSVFNLFGGSYLLKLNQNGDFVWANRLSAGTSSLTGYSNGDIGLSGTYSGNTTIQLNGTSSFPLEAVGASDVYALRADSFGNCLFVKSFGSEDQNGLASICYANLDNLYIAGQFHDTVDFNHGDYPINGYAVGTYDLYIQKINDTGGHEWTKIINGLGDEEIFDITVDINQSIICSGMFTDTIDFDPSANVFTKFTNSSKDGFVLKLEDCVPNSSTVHTVTACNEYTWINGMNYWLPTVNTPNNFTAKHYLSSSDGCDSIIHLDLTIIPVNIFLSNNFNTITAMASSIGVQYQWLDCSNNMSPIPGATNKTYTASLGGYFAVQVTENACTDTSNCIPAYVLDNNSYSFENLISIYPNPNSGIINISSEGVKKASIEIVNMHGQRIYSSKEIDIIKNSIDISSQPKGIYMMRVITNEFENQYKIIFQ